MKKPFVCILVFLIAVLPATAMAQVAQPLGQSGTVLDNPVKKTFSLLDPHRFKISHAYSFSYVSGGGTSGTVGVYYSTIQCQLARPLTLRVGLAYAHNPLSAFSRNTGGIVSEGIYPSIQLDYRPSPNFYLGIGFERAPGYSYSTPWWHGPSDWWRAR